MEGCLKNTYKSGTSGCFECEGVFIYDGANLKCNEKTVCDENEYLITYTLDGTSKDIENVNICDSPVANGIIRAATDIVAGTEIGI